MRILANENLSGETVEALRARGHDVAWVPEDARSASDREILARAQAEHRVVLTFDKDFGELAVRAGLAAVHVPSEKRVVIRAGNEHLDGPAGAARAGLDVVQPVSCSLPGGALLPDWRLRRRLGTVHCVLKLRRLTGRFCAMFRGI